MIDESTYKKDPKNYEVKIQSKDITKVAPETFREICRSKKEAYNIM